MENINRTLDHTLLKTDATEAEILKAANEAKEINAATLCVAPNWIQTVKPVLEGTTTGITTVIGFPTGQNTIESKVFEAKDAIAKGATELDFVINVSKVHERDEEYLRKEVAAMVESANGTLTKLIIEAGLLTNEEVEYISRIAIEGGFDFIKTSTGFFGAHGATVEHVKLMASIAKPAGKEVKASGGVRTYEDAINMIEAGASRLGTSNGVAIAAGKDGENEY